MHCSSCGYESGSDPCGICRSKVRAGQKTHTKPRPYRRTYNKQHRQIDTSGADGRIVNVFWRRGLAPLPGTPTASTVRELARMRDYHRRKMRSRSSTIAGGR